jgi:putative NADH-flavin reductase
MARILVIGGSSGIGAEVARQAAAVGHFVRAMSRGGSLPEWIIGDCEPISGDALNKADVRLALDGVDVVVQALGIPPTIKMVLKPVTLFSKATMILVQQMEEAGVKRLLSVTGFGAGDSRSSINFMQRVPFRLLLGNAYDDKTIQEKLITESNLDWLIVRPGVLTNGDRSDQYKVLLDSKNWRNGIISRADVSDFIVSQFVSDYLLHEKPVLIRYPL